MQTYTDQAGYATYFATITARLFTRGLILEASTSFTGGMGKIKGPQGPFNPLRVQFQLTIPKETWQLRA